jgi:hypothetical protein
LAPRRGHVTKGNEGGASSRGLLVSRQANRLSDLSSKPQSFGAFHSLSLSGQEISRSIPSPTKGVHSESRYGRNISFGKSSTINVSFLRLLVTRNFDRNNAHVVAGLALLVNYQAHHNYPSRTTDRLSFLSPRPHTAFRASVGIRELQASYPAVLEVRRKAGEVDPVVTVKSQKLTFIGARCRAGQPIGSLRHSQALR